MAAPIDAIITLPDDSGNTGKKVRTQTEVVGANTVHTHYFVMQRAKKVITTYRLALVQATVLASAQNGTTAGMLFGHMGSAVSGKAMRIRRIGVSSQHSTALATPTAPRLLIRRFTSSGALNTSLISPNTNDSTQTAPAALFSLVNTGCTVVHVGIGFAHAALAGAITAVGAYEPCDKDMIDPAAEEDAWPVFRPGEGFVIYQDVAGTTSDTRKFNIEISCDEIDIA
ncbi:MAG: hypothetical protein KGZ65_04280 [Sphingomonadales bacterium]|nr:hypothetical protein [Sphingomonadaceae bacterium]MBS3930431.1 hypothetical protein [Sphingomonadales bacterium]